MAFGHGELEALRGTQLNEETQQRRSLQIERCTAFFIQQGSDTLLLPLLVEMAQILHYDRQLRLRPDQLQRLAVTCEIKPGSQHIVSSHRLRHRPAKSRFVEGGVDTQVRGAGTVVNVGVRRQVHMVKHARLHTAQRIGVNHLRRQQLAIFLRNLAEWRSGYRPADALPAAGVQQRRQFGHGLMLEQIDQRQRQPPFAPASDNLYSAQRIAAQRKEVVINADVIHLQHVAPERQQRRLGIGARRLIVARQLRAKRLRIRQRAPVQLAVRG